MPRNPNEITERYVANIKRDIDILMRNQEYVSENTANDLQDLIYVYKREVYDIYMRANTLPPAWCKK